MKIEEVDGVVEITPEKGKAIVNKFEAPEIRTKFTTVITLAKSDNPDNYEEIDLEKEIIEEEITE